MSRLHYLLLVLALGEANKNVYSANYYTTYNIVNDLPQKTDLILYIRALNQIIEYFKSNKFEIDLNVHLGLFLANVNLKAALRHTEDRIKNKINYSILVNLIKQNDELINFFYSMVNQITNPVYWDKKKLVEVNYNEAKWVDQTKIFEIQLIKKYNMNNSPGLERYFTTWSEYTNSIYYNFTPAPELSDKCLVSVSRNVNQISNKSAACVLYSPCYDVLKNGSNYGYGLTHRMLLLLFARNSANCYIFSPDTDKDLINKFCTDMYDEAKQLAIHGFDDMDLFAEQISICSLEGHAEFLRKEWIAQLLRHKTSYGCFNFTLDPYKDKMAHKLADKRWRIQNENGNWMQDGLCNGHVTAVAAATFAGAIRYLLEIVF